MKLHVPLVCVVLSLLPAAHHLSAQETPAVPAPTPLEAALQKVTAEYVEAFNKGDATAFAGFYDESATYTSDSGKFMEGRAAIEAGMKKFLGENPGARLAVQPLSVRGVTDSVAIETGIATFSTGSGAEEVTRFKAVYAKRGEAWKIVELDEAVLPAADRGQVALRGLEWMAGTWKDSGGSDVVTTEVGWTKSQRFLRRSISVQRAGSEVMEATEIIGWDAAKGVLRSWVFDSGGGFGEGVWSQEGNRWIVKTTSTLPDGQRASAMNIFTIKDGNAYTWESTNREAGGEVLPNIEKVEVVREQPAAK